MNATENSEATRSVASEPSEAPVRSSDWLERKDVLKAIADEPEYPGECPPLLMGYIRQAIQDKDEDAILHMMRQTVRLTKDCITERVNGLRSNNEPERPARKT